MAHEGDRATADDYEAFARYLELERMEILDFLALGTKGYTTADLEKLALFGSAISSIRDSAKFRREFDGL